MIARVVKVNRYCAAHGCQRVQAGSMLLEALVAILIFSIGILAVVGMQATAVKAASDARHRTEASLLANELLGQMWVSNRTPSTLQTNFQGSGGSGGSLYNNWYANVAATMPGASSHAPTVTVDSATGMVTIVVQWKLPSEPTSASPHNYTVVAQVR